MALLQGVSKLEDLLKRQVVVVLLMVLCKKSKISNLTPIFRASTGMFYAISLQLPHRFWISMAHSNRMIPSFHFQGRKEEWSD